MSPTPSCVSWFYFCSSAPVADLRKSAYHTSLPLNQRNALQSGTGQSDAPPLDSTQPLIARPPACNLWVCLHSEVCVRTVMFDRHPVFEMKGAGPAISSESHREPSNSGGEFQHATPSPPRFYTSPHGSSLLNL